MGEAGAPVGRLRVATRRSLLARTQTDWVIDRLRRLHPGLEVEVVEIDSGGDTDRSSPIAELSTVGAFTKALEDALLDGSADVAVHSLKDLPTGITAGLVVAAVPEREDPRDALVAAGGLGELPEGARIGTGSPRRRVQLAAIRPDLRFEELRGNVDTRLRKVADGEVDGAVLAAAGLRRIGRADAISEVLPLLPAPGQGALAVECRSGNDDEGLRAMLAGLTDRDARDTVAAERAWLHGTGAGCRTSAAAWARLHPGGDTLTLEWSLEGATGTLTGPRSEAESIGRRAAAEYARQEAQ